MKGRPLPLWCVLILVTSGPALGQEKERPPSPRDRFPGKLSDQAAKPGLREAFPEDTVPPGQRDSLPRIDIASRQAALTEGGFPSRDSLFQTLKDLPGYHVIEYRGREVKLGVQEQSIGLFGEAQVNREREVLKADSIRYLGPIRFMVAHRNIELAGADQKEITSDSVLYYDMASVKGTVYGAETQFYQRGTNWRVIGNVIPKAQDTVFATRSRFTSCEIEEPHYTFRAGRIKLVNQNVIVAWPVVLYVSNVPVFWLPFFASDIRPGRRSGILPPRFGINDVIQTSGGASRAVTDVGYYWAINDFMDAQATIDWFSGNFTRLNGGFRYRWLKKFIRGSVIYSQSFAGDGRNLTLDWGHDQELGLATTLRTSLRYVQDTRLLQDQEFDPRLQTQTIDSDAGLNHRFPFANVSVSARRRQFLTSSKIEQTLPSVNVSFSPVTLFAAPRSREGLFNNITLSGSGSFSRRTDSQDLVDDRTTTNGSAATGVRLRDLNVSGSVRWNDLGITPEDSTGLELPGSSQTTLSWTARADYQFKLIGSTTFRPTLNVDGAEFRSIDTGGDFVSAPTRLSFGASLTTDVFGFYPGFGPFSRIRHKFSPGLDWAYAPDVTVDSALASIPGFPASGGGARNTLTLRFRQTFEAKVRRRAPQQADGARAEPPRVAATADSLVEQAPGAAVGPDTARSGFGAVGPDTSAAGRRDTADEAPPSRRTTDERIITLLAINTSTPLRWDFARSKLDQPTFLTEEISNSISSDLLRGFTLNMTHDLFDGTGPDRRFSLRLTRLTMGFRLRSGQGLGDLLGLGDGGVRPQPPERDRQDIDSRFRLRGFEQRSYIDPFEDPQGGPWDLSVRYSLVRPREGESGIESQTVDGTLSFHPTPKWSVRWTTQYNFTQSEFGQHLITLERDLHRWRASFQFARSPNGNVIFLVSVSLRDAPELHGDYSQRTVP